VYHTFFQLRRHRLQDAHGLTTIAGCIRDGVAPSLGSGAVDACRFLERAVERTLSAAVQAAAVTFAADTVAALGTAESIVAHDSESAGSLADESSVVLDVLESTAAFSSVKQDRQYAGAVAAARWQGLLRRGAGMSAAAKALSAKVLQAGVHADVRMCEMLLRTLTCACATAASRKGAPDPEHVARTVDTMLCGGAKRGGVSDADAPRLMAPAAAALAAVGAPLAPLCERALALLRTSKRKGEIMEDAVAALYQAVWCGFA
jgi:hypothetical protein